MLWMPDATIGLLAATETGIPLICRLGSNHMFVRLPFMLVQLALW